MVTLAAKAETTLEVIRKVERGQVATMHYRTLFKVAHALGASVADMVPSATLRPARRVASKRASASNVN
jgi:hypothetical protein